MTETTFKRDLGLFDGIMLVMGSMIGSGIFIVSADMIRQVGSVGWLIALWALTAVLTTIAAISYGELSALFPKAGGQYVYLKEAYSPRIAFLYGWSFFAVIQTGTIAAVGVAFAKFAAYLYAPLGEQNQLMEIGAFHLTAAQVVAVATIVLLTAINHQGVKKSKGIQSALTVVKVASLLGLLVMGFQAFSADIWQQNWQDAFAWKHYATETHEWLPLGGLSIGLAVSAALVGSVFSSDAWNGVTFIAAELKNPQRNVGLSLFIGTAAVGLIYIAMNLMYVSVLSAHDLANVPSDRIAIAISELVFGAHGTIIVALMIMISTFACNNGLILSGARVYYSMAQDQLFFKQATQLNSQGVPAWALRAQAVWASFLCLTGQYGQLLDFVVSIVLLFYILTIWGIFRLRSKFPDIERPYKAFGFPYLQWFYLACTSLLLVLLFIAKWETCSWGLLIVASGLPVYEFFKRKI
jgi:APA family basic amino acid/polyamine antiporter